MPLAPGQASTAVEQLTQTLEQNPTNKKAICHDFAKQHNYLPKAAITDFASAYLALASRPFSEQDIHQKKSILIMRMVHEKTIAEERERNVANAVRASKTAAASSTHPSTLQPSTNPSLNTAADTESPLDPILSRAVIQFVEQCMGYHKKHPAPQIAINRQCAQFISQYPQITIEEAQCFIEEQLEFNRKICTPYGINAQWMASEREAQARFARKLAHSAQQAAESSRPTVTTSSQPSLDSVRSDGTSSSHRNSSKQATGSDRSTVTTDSGIGGGGTSLSHRSRPSIQASNKHAVKPPTNADQSFFQGTEPASSAACSSTNTSTLPRPTAVLEFPDQLNSFAEAKEFFSRAVRFYNVDTEIGRLASDIHTKLDQMDSMEQPQNGADQIINYIDFIQSVRELDAMTQNILQMTRACMAQEIQAANILRP